MRSSTLISLVAIAAAAPSLAAPVSSAPQYAKRQTTSQSTTTPPTDSTFDETGALSLGAISTIAGFAAPVINGIVDHFRGKNKRDADEAGALFLAPFLNPGIRPYHPYNRPTWAIARADDEDSGAFKMPSLGTISTIAGFAAPVINGIVNHFRGGDKNKREIEELFVREFEEHFARELMTRADGDESGAFFGALLRVIPSVISGISGLFGGNKRELEDMYARAVEQEFARHLEARGADDESGAIWGILARAIPAVISMFNHKRDVEDLHLLLRSIEEDGESGAVSFGTIANVGSLIGSGISVLHNFFSGNKDHKREFEALLARAAADVEESGAANWGKIANIGSLISSGVSVIHNLFSGNQKREFEELLARAIAEDQSGAANWGKIADIGSLISSGVSVFHNLFGGNNQNKREFEELLARAIAEDESAAVNWGTLANIGSLIGSGVSVIHNLFSGNNQNKREFEELLTRAIFEARSLNELD